MTKGIAEATSALDASRFEAQHAATDAITTMLIALQRSLDGKRLRGMANLAASGNPYRALRVRARVSDKALPLPKWRGGEEWGNAVLVLTERGALALVRRNDTGEFDEQPWPPENIKAEDVEHVAETIVAACGLHLAASAKATSEYEDMRQLAERIRGALEGK